MADSEANPPNDDEKLAFTVATVWREERVSCPHPDILNGWLSGSLDDSEGGGFVRFHLDESRCPFCNAVRDDLVAGESQAQSKQLDGMRDRLLRSTVAALDISRGSKRDSD